MWDDGGITIDIWDAENKSRSQARKTYVGQRVC